MQDIVVHAGSPPSTAVLADLEHPDAVMHGVHGELSQGAVSYGLTQEWAQAFRRAGFDGISYALRIANEPRGMALFGPRGSSGLIASKGVVTTMVDVLRLAGVTVFDPAAAGPVPTVPCP